MNIVIAKIGKSIKFNSNNWGSNGGDNEAPLIFKNLAKYNPDINFYIIGKTDFHRLKDDVKSEININNNIIDIWEDFDKKIHDNTTYPYDYFKERNINIDAGIIITGPTSGACIPQFLKKKDGSYCKMLECFKNYAGPVVHYLNKSGIDYFTLTMDPRYHPIEAKDLYNVEKFSLSQYDYEPLSEHIISEEDHTLVQTTVPTYYSDIEKIFFIDKELKDITNMKKTKKFMIVLNEGGNGGLSRGKILEEYILNNFKDIEIYGKWKDKWYEDKRFKGPKKFNDLQELLPQVKYTFIIPIQEGWVTAKFWEMINYGIIPFMHPYYDQQKHIKCDDFLRVNSPEELLEKIDFLEKNPQSYKELLHGLQDLLKEEYYSGKHLNDTIMEGVRRLYASKK